MESFYNHNFTSRQIMKSTDYCNQKVWNIHYDEHIDIVYVFMAKIERTNCGPLLNIIKFN